MVHTDVILIAVTRNRLLINGVDAKVGADYQNRPTSILLSINTRGILITLTYIIISIGFQIFYKILTINN